MIRSKTYSLNIGGRLLEVNRPIIMGVINVTPDSFYCNSRVTSDDEMRHAVRKMIEYGADIIDVGACSTRPGGIDVSAKEEMDRLSSSLPIIKGESGNVPISVDTYRSEIARRCVIEYGVDIINDISGGYAEEDIINVVAKLNVPYVLTHNANYVNVDLTVPYSTSVLRWFSSRISELRLKGISDVIVDPGIGFTPTRGDDFNLLASLSLFTTLNAPILVGLSRKRIVTETLGCTASEALNGTTALNMAALTAGASILRVHDVKQAVEVSQLYNKIATSV